MDFSLNGNDTITIAGVLITKFFDKDYGLASIPNELANMKIGKNGNAVVTFIPGGQMAELTLRILLASSDDLFMNSLQRSFINNPPGFILLNGQLVKQSGDGQGNIRNIVYGFEGGVPSHIPEARSNADGDEEQGVAVWKFKFARVSRSG